MGAPVEQLLDTIVQDIAKASGMAEDDWWPLSKFPLVPLAIPVSTDTQYRVTQVGVDAAHKLTDLMWAERRDLRQTISRKVFDRLSFRAIGQAIQCTARRLPEEAADPEGIAQLCRRGCSAERQRGSFDASLRVVGEVWGRPLPPSGRRRAPVPHTSCRCCSCLGGL